MPTFRQGHIFVQDNALTFVMLCRSKIAQRQSDSNRPFSFGKMISKHEVKNITAASTVVIPRVKYVSDHVGLGMNSCLALM